MLTLFACLAKAPLANVLIFHSVLLHSNKAALGTLDQQNGLNLYKTYYAACKDDSVQKHQWYANVQCIYKQRCHSCKMKLVK